MAWVNYDGTTLKEVEMTYGELPVYDGATPEKAADSSFVYEFGGWFPAPVAVTGDAVYTAEFAGNEITETPHETDLKLSSATLFLYNDLSIVYKIKLSDLGTYEDPYLICTINNRALRIYGELVTENNVQLYRFEFKNVNPQQMSTTVYTVVYATKNGSLHRSEKITPYSVRKYAENQLKKTTTPAVLRTLLVDLLNYGTYAQIYKSYRMVDLANSTLTPEQLAEATQEVPELTNVAGQGPAIDSPSVAWKAVTLLLDKAVQIRFKIQCEDISGLKAQVVTDYGRTFEITSDKFDPIPEETNTYYLYVNELNFAHMRSKIDITFVNSSNEAVSRTYSYSVASYAVGKINNTSTEANLLALVTSLMKFGASAEAYSAQQ